MSKDLPLPGELAEQAFSRVGIDNTEALKLFIAAISVTAPEDKLTQEPTCFWIESAFELAVRIVQQRMQQVLPDSEVIFNTQTIDTLYDPASKYYSGDDKQALQVCLAAAFYYQLQRTRSVDKQNCATISMATLQKLNRAMIAAYRCEQFQLCLRLAAQSKVLASTIEKGLWSTDENDIRDTFDYLVFLVHDYTTRSLYALERFEAALESIERYADDPYMLKCKVLANTRIIFKANILLSLNRVDQARQLFEQLSRDKGLTIEQQALVDIQLSQIEFINTGDPRDALKTLVYGLTQSETQELFDIFDSEMSGSPSTRQIRRKQELLTLAFSEAGIQRAVEDSQSEVLEQNLRQYRHHHISPRLGQPEFQSVSESLKAHEIAVANQQWAEASRTLIATGQLIESGYSKTGRLNTPDLEAYLSATIATNQLEEYLTQAESLAAVLSRGSDVELKPLQTSLERYFRQFVRLATQHSAMTTAQRHRTQMALRKSTTENLLILLAELVLKLPNVNGLWARTLAQLKRFFDFNGLNIHQQQQLHKYRLKLSATVVAQIDRLSERLTTIPEHLPRGQ